MYSDAKMNQFYPVVLSIQYVIHWLLPEENLEENRKVIKRQDDSSDSR